MTLYLKEDAITFLNRENDFVRTKLDYYRKREVFKSASDRWIDAPNVQYITAEYYRREIQGGRDGIIKAAEEASRSSGAFLLEYKLTLEQEGWFTGRKV